MIVTESQFSRRTQHAVRRHAAHTSLRDLETTREYGAYWRQWDVVAHRDVVGTTDNLQWTVGGVHDDQSNTISAIDCANLIDASNDNFVESLPHELGTFNHESKIVEDYS
jgi:hypothetical protein